MCVQWNFSLSFGSLVPHFMSSKFIGLLKIFFCSMFCAPFYLRKSFYKKIKKMFLSEISQILKKILFFVNFQQKVLSFNVHCYDLFLLILNHHDNNSENLKSSDFIDFFLLLLLWYFVISDMFFVNFHEKCCCC